jgi:hypothetical protein
VTIDGWIEGKRYAEVGHFAAFEPGKEEAE